MNATTSSASANRVLMALRDGNQRFRRDAGTAAAFNSRARREALVRGQTPGAIVLSCADSRSAAEIVFDCALGELFNIRVAGNICAPALVGSVEFAAENFGAQLVVVMGHTLCGAVDATLSALQNAGGDELSPNVKDIVDRITPAVAPLLALGLDRTELLRMAIRANISHSVAQLRHASPILERRIAREELVVVGAEYDIATGEVEFCDMPVAVARRSIAPRATPSIAA